MNRQQEEAMAKGVAIRGAILEARREIKAGDLKLEAAIDDPRLGRERVDRFLRSFYGIGPVKVPGIVRRAGLQWSAEVARVEDLTARQKERLAACAVDVDADFRGSP